MNIENIVLPKLEKNPAYEVFRGEDSSSDDLYLLSSDDSNYIIDNNGKGEIYIDGDKISPSNIEWAEVSDVDPDSRGGNGNDFLRGKGLKSKVIM